MKKVFLTGMMGAALLAVPALTFAQKNKDKSDKTNVQTIVITRHGDSDGKTVIEIDGDKVKVNGKDAKDAKDVSVNVTNVAAGMPGTFRYNVNGNAARTWSMDMNGDQASLFREDGTRPMLGVVTEGSDKGVEIRQITEGGAADKAGLKKGDVVTRIGDKKIESTDDVTAAVKAHKVGDKVDITYKRDGKESKATAELTKWKGLRVATTMPRTLEELNIQTPNVDMAPFETFGSYYSFGRPKLGLSIQDTDDGKGVKVLEVDQESNAAKAGLKKDDIILSIDDKEVKSTDDLTRAVRANREKYVYNFKVQRDGKVQNMEVKMPRKLKTADL